MSEQVITAAEMQEGQVYKTCESELSYFSKLVAKGEKIKITALMPKTGKWKELEVYLGYKVRPLNEAEVAEFATLSEPKAKKEKKPKAPKDPNAPKRAPIVKANGAVTGKGVVEAWAYYINQNIGLEGGRTKTIDAMIAEFPNRAEAIRKWVDAYKGYFNIGRFARFGMPKRDVKLDWVLNASEKEELAKSKPSKKAVEVPVA